MNSESVKAYKKEYTRIRKDLFRINSDISTLISTAKATQDSADNIIVDWEKSCKSLRKRLGEDIIRIAVVGPIKSGKSTFLNALFGGDYLKRGAGVVTSIVTRIQAGKHSEAKLYFKSWGEVNSEIEKSLEMFPSLKLQSKGGKFNIRQKKDRMSIQKAIGELNAEQIITNGRRNANIVLISFYLKGYDRVKDELSSNNKTREYKGNLFQKHKDFVGDEVLAVYLKDVLLKINSNAIGVNIEIADCQGSDSSNPLHIAMIQDYLFSTHLIIYVVSSRTGLRQADIRFLSMIKSMRIMDNFLFVLNCDFSEHESVENKKNLAEKVKEEISAIKPVQEIYSFSALYNLFKTINKNLPQKDKMRFAQWQNETGFVDFSDKETERFKYSFERMLGQKRYSLLLKNYIERHDLILSDIMRWAGITAGFLERDASETTEIIKRINRHQEGMDKIKSMVNNTISGAVPKIKNEIKRDVNRFFDTRSSDVLGDIIGFIRNYKVSYRKYEENLKSSGFLNTLYLVFQEFKQALDTSVVENLTPEVIGFAREMEKKIYDDFKSVFRGYEAVIEEALAEYDSVLNMLQLTKSIKKEQRQIKMPDMDSIKEASRLKIPPVITFIRYSAKIKTEAVMKLGFLSVIRIFKRIIQKPISDNNSDELKALKSGIRRMKRETEKSVIFHLNDYKENVKFKYLIKLVDVVSGVLDQELLRGFNNYADNLSRLNEGINTKKVDKKKTHQILAEIMKNIPKINDKIMRMKGEIELTK
ncbi:MAG: dynamin family protein [Desulfobacterales bacterium]|nr:dynamin family protein [Desulfobacterales bacterium]